MTSSAPLRRLFDSAERLVGRPLERVVAVPQASYVFLTVRGVAMSVPRHLESARGAALHLLALPSYGDIRRLAVQVSRLQSSVDEIEQVLVEQKQRSG
jgi:hypothetical protein